IAQVLLHVDGPAVLDADLPPFVIPLENSASDADALQIQGREIRHNLIPETPIIRSLHRLILPAIHNIQEGAAVSIGPILGKIHWLAGNRSPLGEEIAKARAAINVQSPKIDA